MMDLAWAPLLCIVLQRGDEEFPFLNCMSLFHLYSLVSSARLYSANLDGWDALRMYCVEEEALTLGLGSQPDSFAETFRVTTSSPSPPVLIELDQTGTPVSAGPLPLHSRVKTPTKLPRFEGHHFLPGR